MNPLVSILIPVYNREKIISETIDCAVNQTHENIEIIIFDNCSTDSTWEILQEWTKKDSRIKIFRNEENLGPVLNWKECLDRASGEYAKILWSDDLMSETFIEHTLPLFDDNTAFVITGICVFDSDTRAVVWNSIYQKRNSYTKDEYLCDILLYNKKRFPVSPGTGLFRLNDLRKSFIIDVPNKENLDFKMYGAGNDLLFYLITANQYEQVKVVNGIESFFREHKNSITTSCDNILGIYYEYARFYFVENYYPILLSKYKSKLLIKKLMKKKYAVLYNNITISPKIVFTFFSILNEIKKNIFSH